MCVCSGNTIDSWGTCIIIIIFYYYSAFVHSCILCALARTALCIFSPRAGVCFLCSRRTKLVWYTAEGYWALSVGWKSDLEKIASSFAEKKKEIPFWEREREREILCVCIKRRRHCSCLRGLSWNTCPVRPHEAAGLFSSEKCRLLNLCSKAVFNNCSTHRWVYVIYDCGATSTTAAATLSSF